MHDMLGRHLAANGYSRTCSTVLHSRSWEYVLPSRALRLFGMCFVGILGPVFGIPFYVPALWKCPPAMKKAVKPRTRYL